MKFRLTSTFIGFAIFATACRTTADDKTEAKPPLTLTPAETEATPLLKKAIGEVTKQYATNRIEDCVILRRDVSDLDEVDKAIANVKTQKLVEGFILRAQIPSIQYFAYADGAEILLGETNDAKNITRVPEGEVGNLSIQVLMNIFEQKCGPNSGEF